MVKTSKKSAKAVKAVRPVKAETRSAAGKPAVEKEAAKATIRGATKKSTKASAKKAIVKKSAPKRIVAKRTATRRRNAKKQAGPLISIVMPVHNGAEFIDDTIHSVLGQTYENWELIIVDDASTDRTMEVLAQFSSEQIRVIRLERNGGAAQARNRGVSEAKGRYLCFLDADDLWQPDKLARQLNFMREKDCAFSFAGYVFADADGKPRGKVVRVPEEITYKQALKNTTIWTSTVMFDMGKLSKEDVEMPNVASEDTATWWKILKKVGSAYGLNEVMAIYRRGGKTLSSNKMVAIKRIWRLYRNSENLNVVVSSVNFVGWAFNAVRRRG